MNPTQQLIERARSHTATGSYYAVAKALGFSTARVSNYTTGRYEITDDDTICHIARFIGEDPAQLLAHFRMEKATSPDARAAWQRLETLAKHAGILGLNSDRIAA